MESTHDSQNIIQQHPVIGLLYTILALIAAEAPALDTWDYPVWVKSSFQILAWSSAFGVFLISAHGWYKKNYKDK